MLEEQAQWRLFAFILGLLFFILLETIQPKRKQQQVRLKRWSRHLVIAMLNTGLLRVVFPVLPAGIALWAAENHLGLFNLIDMPVILAVIVTIILFDFIIYWQHRLLHLIPVLWRLHRMHHTDLELDATSGVRFHPFEMIFSMMIKIIAVVLLGVPFLGIVVFEILLNLSSLWTHTNVRLPSKLERWMRYLIVTPDMHRIHHSIQLNEMNSNFGFNFSWWDKLFASYKHQASDDPVSMPLGLARYRDSQSQKIVGLLKNPFRHE